MRTGISLALLLFIGMGFLAHAHSEPTGDPAHDANLAHEEPTLPSSSGITIPLWGVGLFFLGLILFSLAMGYYLHPGSVKR